MAFKHKRFWPGLTALGIGFALMGSPAGALAAVGGVAPPGAAPPAPISAPTATACSMGGGGVGSASSCGPTGKATLLPTGLAVAPVDAPRGVKRAIRWANQIVDMPYRLGGGHRLPWRMDSAYDCSGTVSWALRGAKLLKAPVPSGSFARWGAPGVGRWITVYYHGGHVYAVIAGLRLDTSMVAGSGPGWSTKMRSSAGFSSRFAPGL